MVVQGIYGTGNPRTIGLDRLIALLTRLKSFEFQNPSADLWNDEPVHASHQTTLSDAPNANHDLLPDLLRSLEESKACMAALNEVWDHLRRRICCLQKACTPFVLEKGIRTLPDEILSDIFEAGHRMTEGWTFAKSVSQVSPRFRQVSLQTPLLWTRLSLDYVDADGQLQAFLSRSGTLGLEVSIDEDIEKETILPCLQILYTDGRVSKSIRLWRIT